MIHVGETGNKESNYHSSFEVNRDIHELHCTWKKYEGVMRKEKVLMKDPGDCKNKDKEGGRLSRDMERA